MIRHPMLVMAVALVLAGCARGAPFQPLETLSQDKAVIYIYRPSAFGFAVDYDVKRGDAVIVTMKSHGYYPYVTDPGLVELSATTETTTSVTLDVEPGETTADGRVTLLSVECLCACELAPMMQVDDGYEGVLTPEKVDRILVGLG